MERAVGLKVMVLRYNSCLPPGKGYSEEPLVQVLDSDKQTVLLALDQRWILERWLFATSMVMAHLRDFATTAPRLRGIEIPASPFNPVGLDVFSFGFLLDLLPKKRSEYSLSIINGTSQGWGTSENYLIDTTSATQGNFDDAFLSIGRTFSDYEADSHLTPISKEG